MENPNHLSNIFLRFARYTMFKGRHIDIIPPVQTLIPTVLDYQSKKYQKGRWEKYEAKLNEWKAIASMYSMYILNLNNMSLNL